MEKLPGQVRQAGSSGPLNWAGRCRYPAAGWDPDTGLVQGKVRNRLVLCRFRSTVAVFDKIRRFRRKRCGCWGYSPFFAGTNKQRETVESRACALRKEDR
jgi:hypothetical protein